MMQNQGILSTKNGLISQDQDQKVNVLPQCIRTMSPVSSVKFEVVEEGNRDDKNQIIQMGLKSNDGKLKEQL